MVILNRNAISETSVEKLRNPQIFLGMLCFTKVPNKIKMYHIILRVLTWYDTDRF